MKATNIEHLWRNWSSWLKFQEPLKKLYSVKFYQALTQQQVKNKVKTSEVVQTKTHVGSTTPTPTTPPKSAKPPTKQLLHKSPIRALKSIKDRLKILPPQKPEQFKQKSQVLNGQAGKIQMNTKVNNERPGSTFKQPSIKSHTVPSISRTKSPIRINKQFNVQGSTKPLQRTYSEESMNSDTDRIVASLKEIIKNHNA